MNFRGFGLVNGRYDFLRSADTEGSGGNEGEGAPQTDADAGTPAGTDDVDAKIAAAVAAAVEAATTGLKKKNEELIGKTKKLAGDLEAAKGKPTLTDEEYSKYAALKERMERDELLKALAEGDAEGVINKVTAKTRLDFEAKLKAETEAKDALGAKAAAAQSKLEEFVINLEITKAAAAAVKPQYNELINTLIAPRVKLVDGTARIVDAQGEVVVNAAGTPISVADHIETMRATYADLFVPSTGGGAGGSGKKSPGGNAGRIATDMSESLEMDQWIKLRQEGRIV